MFLQRLYQPHTWLWTRNARSSRASESESEGLHGPCIGPSVPFFSFFPSCQSAVRHAGLAGKPLSLCTPRLRAGVLDVGQPTALGQGRAYVAWFRVASVISTFFLLSFSCSLIHLHDRDVDTSARLSGGDLIFRRLSDLGGQRGPSCMNVDFNLIVVAPLAEPFEFNRRKQCHATFKRLGSCPACAFVSLRHVYLHSRQRVFSFVGNAICFLIVLLVSYLLSYAPFA